MNDTRLRRVCATLVLGALPFSCAIADIYKCVEDGKPAYQDQPCRGPGTTVAVKPAAGQASEPTAAGAQDSLSRLKANVSEMEQSRRKRDIAYEIDRLERDIREYERVRDAQLAELRKKQDYAKYNQPGAIWERGWLDQSITAETRAVTGNYGTRIQAANDRISQLRKEAAEVGKTR